MSTNDIDQPTDAEAGGKPLAGDVPALADADAIEAEVADLSRGQVVALASPALSGKQRSYLRGLAHPLEPTAMIGKNGLGTALAEAIDAVLETHELVKVKLTENAACSVGAAAVWIHRATGAQVPQILGRTLVAYRRRKKKPKIQLPGT